MKTGSKNMKRALSYLLLVGLLLSLLPVTGFAAGYADNSDAAIVALHKTMDTTLEYAVNTNLEKATSGIVGDADLTPPHKITEDAWPAEVRIENKIDVYPMTKSMSESDRSSVVIPFIDDAYDMRWYLYQIIWTNNSTITSATGTGTVVSADEIVEAANQSNAAAYTFDLTEINAEPKLSGSSERYYIVYCWTDIAPSLWGTEIKPAATYNVKYTSTLPTDLGNSYRIYPYDKDGVISITEDGIGLNGMQADIASLSRSVVEGRYFEIGKSATGAPTSSQHSDYLVFDHNNKIYYYLNGWKDKNDTLHQYGETIQATETLADSDNTITLTADWKKIDLLTDEQLANYAEKLPITVFYPGSDVIGSVLMTQWTDTDANTQYNDNTANPVALDEKGTISYLVSARISSGLTSVSDENVMQYSENFATFTFHVNVDGQLKFANLNDDGKATLTFESTILKPTGTNFTVGGSDTAVITDNGNETYSIIFDPSAVPTDSEGNMDIQITTKWVAGTHSLSDISQSVRLTGLDFQLKDNVTDPATFKIESSANITGRMDMKNKIPANFRPYYRAAYGLLTGSEWQAQFGDDSEPTALVHALQFMDYKLKNIDLANDPMIEMLDANTVTAYAAAPVTITPADITVYTGGEGYTGVVDSAGSQTTTENGLPEPGYYITLPDWINEQLGGDEQAVDLSEILTLTYADEQGTTREWGLELYGTDAHSTDVAGADRARYIYRILPSGEGTENEIPVRLQLTDPDDSDKVIISDEFTPSTSEQYKTYQISIYAGGLDPSKITAQVKLGRQVKPCTVESDIGQLVVRGLTADNATTEIVKKETDITTDKISAVAPNDVTYYVNGSNVAVADASGVKLLVDDVLSDGVLAEYIEENMDAIPDGNYTYEEKYLDLVDTKNGNAYLTLGENQKMTMYWPVPSDMNTSKDYYIVHFEALDRNYNNMDQELKDTPPTTVTGTSFVTVNGKQYIKFETGSFSPFVLVYEKTSGGGGGGTTTYTITASTGTGGTIDPSGKVSVTAGSSKTFTIAAADGYEIADVLVDGKSVGAVSTYTFEKVNANHTISASFEKGLVVADPDDTGVSSWLNTKDHAQYLNGYPEGTFEPDNNMTRAEAAQMFYNLLLDQDVESAVAFSDVPADA